MRDVDRKVLGLIEKTHVIRKFAGTTKRLEALGLIQRTGPLRYWTLTADGRAALDRAKAVEARGTK